MSVNPPTHTGCGEKRIAKGLLELSAVIIAGMMWIVKAVYCLEWVFILASP